MTIHIDMHIVAAVISILLIGSMLALWAKYSRRLPGFVFVFCLSLIFITVSQSDLSAERIQSIFLIGLVLTVLVMTGLYACLSSWKKRRLPRPAPVALRLPADDAHAPSRRAPAPVRSRSRARYYEQEEEEPELLYPSSPEEEEQEYYVQSANQRRVTTRGRELAGRQARTVRTRR